MNRAQRDAVEALGALMPGAKVEADALHDGSVLVNVRRRRPANRGPVGCIALDRGGNVVAASVARA